jgi:hypothetical protein
MQPRIATGPVGDPQRVKALILADPSIIEDGFRVLDVDLNAGPAGTIDILGVDSVGTLTILSVAPDDADAALPRLLDQYGWASDQRALLERLYAAGGLSAGLPFRCLILAPAFSHAFVRRLSLLSVGVTPYLMRDLTVRGESMLLVEPAAPLLGLTPENPVGTGRRSEPGSVLGSTHGLVDDTRRARTEETVPVPRDGDEFLEYPALVEAELLPTSDTADSVGGPGAALGDDAGPVVEDAVPADPFETLTMEEMEEFERFERQRRGRERRSS